MSKHLYSDRKSLIQGFDQTDIDIIKLLIKGDGNKGISSKLKIPLSTIQRRTKRLMEKVLIILNRLLNNFKFGYNTGLLLIYSSDGNINELAKKILDLDGITSVEIHIGNTDVLAEFAYKDGKQLFDVISKIKKIKGVDRLIWSERITRLRQKDGDIDLLMKI